MATFFPAFRTFSFSAQQAAARVRSCSAASAGADNDAFLDTLSDNVLALSHRVNGIETTAFGPVEAR
jgi:hypothetical protein